MTMRAIINQGMIDALDVDFELGGDVHVLGAGEHPGIDDVGDEWLDIRGQDLRSKAPGGRGKLRLRTR
jgi:hypothetical protein